MGLEKRNVMDLAVFGGPPRFVEPLHVGRPHFGERARLLECIEGALDRRWVANNGPLVQQLESRIVVELGVKHCVAIVNGTVGLEMLARALALTGEVVVPAYTFVATAHAFQWMGLTPVFCDVNPVTHSVDVGKVEECFTERTSAIVGVHLWGEPCDIDGLAAFAAERDVHLLFDAAHAFGCSWRGRMIGNFGRAEVFSFHATKFFHTFEGGAITTNDDQLAARLRLMRNFGFAGYDSVVDVGTNAKMTEIAAAMGLTGLEVLPILKRVNRDRWIQYRAHLSALPGIRVFPYTDGEARNYQYVVIEVDAPKSGLSRDHLLAILHAENVLARRYFYPGCHRMEPYRSLAPNTRRPLPATDALSERVIVLPTGHSAEPSDVDAVCEILRFALDHAGEISARLAQRALP